jgi:L-amino acid N-acyltransferase YncA
MQIVYRPVADSDCDTIVNIMNRFVRESFAAYNEHEFDRHFFDYMKGLCKDYSFYVAEAESEGVIGFGLIRPYHPADSFRRCAELTYFILPEFTGHGIGTGFLNRLLADARALNIATLLASISSRNEQSLAFHNKHGFTECGRFRGIGKKHGQIFDVVWMQRFL